MIIGRSKRKINSIDVRILPPTDTRARVDGVLLRFDRRILGKSISSTSVRCRFDSLRVSNTGIRHQAQRLRQLYHDRPISQRRIASSLPVEVSEQKTGMT